MSPTFCTIVAFSDIAIYLRQIKSAFPLIFSNRNCLINEQALICTDDHTQQHNCFKLLTQRWCATSCSSLSGNLLPGVAYTDSARLWKGIIVVLNAVEADRIHFLTCQGHQPLSGSLQPGGLCKQRQMNLLASTYMHVWPHLHTHTDRRGEDTLYTGWLSPASVRIFFLFFF